MSHAIPLPVPLTTDSVAPCRLTFGYLAVAGAAEDPRSPADNALFFETSESFLGRVTFEGLDSIRASRGEVAPYDDGHDFSSWVYSVRDSIWLAERHSYEWENYETPLLETHQHYLFCFHDEFVEAIAEGIWLDITSADDPFHIDGDHPFAADPFVNVSGEGVAHGLPWEVRTGTRPPTDSLAASGLCSQRLFDFILHLEGKDQVCASALLRTREGRTRTHLTMPWVGIVASTDGIASPDDFAEDWDRYCGDVAQRRRDMGK